MYIDLSLIGFSLESNNVYGSISDIVQVSSVNVHILRVCEQKSVNTGLL